MRVAIAGAGIAGLTAAVALARRGVQVDVFEKAAQLEEIGAGIQLSPNATGILDRLGVLSLTVSKGCEPEAIEIGLAGTGAHLARVPLGETARNRYGAPYAVIHRADLQAALLDAARAIASVTLHFHAEVHEVRTTDAGVVFSAGGRHHMADVLVVADGVHSRLRASVFGRPGAEPVGRVAWRATLPRTAVPAFADRNVVGLWFGAGGHLVHYPVTGGTSLNIVVIAGDSAAPAPPAQPFGATLSGLIAAVPAWQRWPLLRVDPARDWVKGRVVLLGDAAHAMPPSAAQGGAQAIEDAWVLARVLEAEPNPRVALAHYEQHRRPRIRRVAREADRNLWVYDLGGPLAAARNLIVSAMPASLHLARMDWLFRIPPD
jgi:salicylate hydroxylase